MDVIINADCLSLPEQGHTLKSQGRALLNCLAAVGYDIVNPPVAEILKRMNHFEGGWLVMTPVHWQATHNDALITAAGKDTQVDSQSLKSCFEFYSRFIAEDGMTLHYYDEDFWLLCAEDKPKIHAKPVFQLIGQSLMPELAQLDGSLFWQKLITESQMFFATQNMSSGINGIWVWGGGTHFSETSLSICADTQWISFANIISKNVTLYQPNLDINRFHIVLIDVLDSLSLAHQAELQKRSVNWFWNNLAYSSKQYNLIKRFWRKLIHAD